MRKLVIPIDKWLHGKNDNSAVFDGAMPGSLLHRPQDGKLCCIGHYLSACGVALEALSEKETPGDLSMYVIPEEAKWLADRDGMSSQPALDLMQENDTHARQDWIADKFLEHGVEVEFIDGAVPA